ncbi:YeiH family protein [Pseudoroseicyclus aestuarii]|uniref:Putative integral membrane protein (TIGR00698 family) n=1 Tax=Pseudoroseicyclus aestuarii TaxID=1795041 RepID=A0A318SSM6_9RHOB|nr:putative sulfate exporter family transporter [Pseudoroseicyclus aestuarii]PYE84830.1 putative integral membrane protein (TIGR00698 family) [Pseudoroseicyclus aestuarii]
MPAPLARILPGLALSLLIALAALALERAELALFGGAWIEGLVLAILLGTALHTAMGLPERVEAGVDFAAKPVLEVAIVLLGASVSLSAIAAAGWALPLTVVAITCAALGLGYGIGRALGLAPRLAILVACGNAICGNSAIVAAAPAIGAEADDVAASIAFTAALGVVVVVALPLVAALVGLSQAQTGVLAGLTVYAVPQVLAAAAPAGALAVQTGTLVKLMRVLMLGPVILLLGLTAGRLRGEAEPARLPITQLVPPFVLGFLALMGLRSLGLLPEGLVALSARASEALTLVAMAALGLSVNLRSVLSSGLRVLGAGALALTGIAAMAAVAAMLLPL